MSNVCKLEAYVDSELVANSAILVQLIAHVARREADPTAFLAQVLREATADARRYRYDGVSDDQRATLHERSAAAIEDVMETARRAL